MLSSGNENKSDGALEVLAKFMRDDPTPEQLLSVLSSLLPTMYNILCAPQQHSALTRARILSLFCLCSAIKGGHADGVRDMIQPLLSAWLHALLAVLQSDPIADGSTNNWDDFVLRIHACRTLVMLYTLFPRVLASHLPDLLSACLDQSIAIHPTYVQVYRTDAIPSHTPGGDGVREVPALIAVLIDFVASTSRTKVARQWVKENVDALVQSAARWAQMPIKNEEDYATDTELFVTREDEQTAVYGVRVAMFDLFGVLLATFPGAAARALDTAIDSAVHAWKTHKPESWRALEAALALAAAQAEALLDTIDDEVENGRPAPVNIAALLTGVAQDLAQLNGRPFLQSSALVFASSFAPLSPVDQTKQYLDAAARMLESPSTGVALKICAVKAVKEFSYARDNLALGTAAPRLAKDLAAFLLQTTKDRRSLVLETLQSIVAIKAGGWLDVPFARGLTPVLLEVCAMNIEDPVFLSILSELLTTIVLVSPDIYDAVTDVALPRLSSALSHPDSSQTWSRTYALNLLGALACGSPASTGLGPSFVFTTAPGIFTTLATAEKRDVLRAGISLLTLLVRRDAQALFHWTDVDGCNGLGHALILAQRLIQVEDEAIGFTVGKLLVHILRKASDTVLPILPDLLHQMLSRMRTAHTAVFLQSLLIPFAFLMHVKRDELLDMIEAINIDNKSGMQVLLECWVENSGSFRGFWARRVSTLALCDILASGRPSVSNVIVKGNVVASGEIKDEHTPPDAAIETGDTGGVKIMRSRIMIAAVEVTRVPFPVKALQLLVHELQAEGEVTGLDTTDLPDNDEGSDWDDDATSVGGEDLLHPNELTSSSKNLESDVAGSANDEDEDLVRPLSEDEELRNEPIVQVDIKAYVISFIKQWAGRDANGFEGLVQQLTKEQQAVMQRAVDY